MNRPDYIVIESAEEYHAKRNRFLSSHALADFRKCPELFHKKESWRIEEGDRPAYAIGRAAHCLILEGAEAFNLRYSVGEPVNPQTGKAYGKNTLAYQEWYASQDKDIISTADFNFIRRLQVSVCLHGMAAEFLREGVAEGVARAEYCGVLCQIRMDFFNETHGIIDLKTCDNLTWFELDARSFSYVCQLAFYRAVLKVVSGRNFPVHIIAVEKNEPFRCGVWKISDAALDSTETENYAAIGRLKKCRAENVWPSGYEEIRTLDSI